MVCVRKQKANLPLNNLMGEEAIGPIRKLSLYPFSASSAFMQNSEKMLFLPQFNLTFSLFS